MLVIAAIMSITGVVLGVFFIVYGFRAGVRRGRILERHPDGYAEGLRARVRGGLYVVIGIAFLFGSGLCFAVIHAKMTDGNESKPPNAGLQPIGALSQAAMTMALRAPAAEPERSAVVRMKGAPRRARSRVAISRQAAIRTRARRFDATAQCKKRRSRWP